jgi:transcriptional regulator with XRE-family HTH domain
MLMEDIHQDAPGRNKLPPLPGEADPDAVLARRLRELRETARLTQRQLADRMTGAGYQMHQTTIAKIEAGQRPVIVGEAVALARIIGVDLAALVTEPAAPDSRELANAKAALAAAERDVDSQRHQVAERAAILASAQEQLDRAQAALQGAQDRFRHAKDQLRK